VAAGIVKVTVAPSAASTIWFDVTSEGGPSSPYAVISV